MDAVKGALKSKTMLFAGGLITAGMAEQFGSVITELVPAEYKGIAIALVGVVAAVLRWRTDRALSEK
jgi:hypothetical protein